MNRVFVARDRAKAHSASLQSWRGSRRSRRIIDQQVLKNHLRVSSRFVCANDVRSYPIILPPPTPGTCPPPASSDLRVCVDCRFLLSRGSTPTSSRGVELRAVAAGRLVAFRPFSRKDLAGLPPSSRYYLACFDPRPIRKLAHTLDACMGSCSRYKRVPSFTNFWVSCSVIHASLRFPSGDSPYDPCRDNNSRLAYPLSIYDIATPVLSCKFPASASHPPGMMITNSSSLLFLALLGGVLAWC